MNKNLDTESRDASNRSNSVVRSNKRRPGQESSTGRRVVAEDSGGEQHKNPNQNQRARSRHRVQRPSSGPFTTALKRGATREQQQSSSWSPNKAQPDQDESKDDVITLSATIDPNMEKHTVVTLAAELDDGPPWFCKAKFDRGCVPSLMSSKLVRRFKLDVWKAKQKLKLRGISRFQETTQTLTKLYFRIRPLSESYGVVFWVLSEKCMVNDIVLGRKFLVRNKIGEDSEIWRAATAEHSES